MKTRLKRFSAVDVHGSSELPFKQRGLLRVQDFNDHRGCDVR